MGLRHSSVLAISDFQSWNQCGTIERRLIGGQVYPGHGGNPTIQGYKEVQGYDEVKDSYTCLTLYVVISCAFFLKITAPNLF